MKKKSLLGQLLSEAKKSEIAFGIHENCVVLSVNNDVRKNKDNEVIKRNCFTVFGKLNNVNEIVAEKEISWFNIDPSTEWAYDNFFTQLEQMTAIVDALFPVAEGEKDVWDLAFEQILAEEEVELTKDSLEKAIKNKKTCASIVKSLGDTYVELLSDLVGPESQRVRLKIVYDSNGKYLQQPKYNAFVESMEVDKEDSKLKIVESEKGKSNTAAPTASKPKLTSI